jgi:hypothetical protein
LAQCWPSEESEGAEIAESAADNSTIMEIARLIVSKALDGRILQGQLEMSISEINAALPSEFRESFCSTPGNHPDGRRRCGDIGRGSRELQMLKEE